MLPLALLCLLGACARGPDAPPAEADADPPVLTVADTTADAETRAAFERIMAEARAERWHEQEYGVLVQTVAAALLGARYEEGLLDVHENEALVVNLAAFDCVLYVENVLALAGAIARQDYAWETYTANLEALRYRGGHLEGYCSRLHYFTDWIWDNARRGHVRDVTQEVGGEPFAKTVNFMGTHRDAYPRLAADSIYQCIVGVEAALRERALYYVPEARVRAVYGRLQPGDVVATATDIEGLDVTHTGFVYRTPEGGTGFIHASLTGEVKVSEDLASYLEDNERQVGIIVARPVPPPGVSAAGSR
jgi:hypothetical protein